MCIYIYIQLYRRDIYIYIYTHIYVYMFKDVVPSWGCAMVHEVRNFTSLSSKELSPKTLNSAFKAFFFVGPLLRCC